MMQVTRQGDAVRKATMPGAVLLHSFTATSDFEAFQKNHDWNGFRRWRPEPDWIERMFTDDEAAEQQAYLANRDA